MRAFACPVCHRLVPFEAHSCLHSGTRLGLDWSTRELVDVDGGGEGGLHRCANETIAACNAVVDRAGTLCRSCALTRTRPADADTEGLARFAAAEAAKRRLLFSLLELGLPVDGYLDRAGGLAFDFLSSDFAPVTTGHADGVITLDLSESDPAEREQRRMDLGEPYRTLLGHLRHEVAHYYDPLLAPDPSPARDAVRRLFGDEREDYQAAMDRHYAQGAPRDWAQSYVSAYASMHPWEDWAETFAHYLHITDTWQTATAYGVRVDGPAVVTTDPERLHTDPGENTDFAALLNRWFPLTYAMNAINRSMGARDLYPFVIAPATQAKLTLVDRLVRAAAAAPEGASSRAA